jgi:hypothetical protein
MIEVQNIRNVDANDIVNLLLDEKQQPFQIYFFKETVLFSSSSEAIADDYARLSYTGYRLNQVANKIDYDVVLPQDHESILFEVDSKNIELLAEVLLELSYLYGNEPDNIEEEYDFWGDVYQYLDNLESGKETPICPEFFEIYQEYANPEEDEEETDEDESSYSTSLSL